MRGKKGKRGKHGKRGKQGKRDRRGKQGKHHVQPLQRQFGLALPKASHISPFLFLILSWQDPDHY